MAEFVPTAIEENVGVNEALLHAQKIIDAFSKALSDNNCMTQIPIAIYSEAQSGVDQMEDALIALGDGNNSNIDRKYSLRAKQQEDLTTTVKVEEEPEFVLNDITNALRKLAGEECIDCGWDDFPEFSIDNIWENSMTDLEDWLS